VWIHGVSVGEVKTARPLVRALRERRPDLPIALSSTTPTGFEVAGGLYPDLFRFYYPLDLPFVPPRVLRRVRPGWIILMELEIWPNFLRAASRADVPVAVVNGRISERSWRGYRRARRLLPRLDRIALYCVQNRRYAERFLDLGVPPSRVLVTGNMKFDNVRGARGAPPDPELKALLGVRSEEPVFVGGSTHADEEAICFRATRRAGASLRRALRLVLVPRHPERAGAIAAALRAEGGEPILLTRLRAAKAPAPARATVVVDTIGELERIYALADVVYVGGSLVPHGGQNVLEPAAFGKPVLFGPHTDNFEEEVARLLEGGAARRVSDEEGLGQALVDLLADPGEARAMGERGADLVESSRGATSITLEALDRRFLAEAPWSPGVEGIRHRG
jgi:3-deoxy-D-manno-octulosonic-acid transferase